MAGQQVYVHCDLSCAQICALDLHMHSHGIDKIGPVLYKAGVLSIPLYTHNCSLSVAACLIYS